MHANERITNIHPRMRPDLLHSHRANELIERIKAWPEFEKATDELCYFMQFRQRGILYRFQTECILKPLIKEYTPEEILELPKSFLFSDCGYYEEYAKLLKEKVLP